MAEHQSFNTLEPVRSNSEHLAVADLILAGVRECPGLVIDRVCKEKVTSPTGKASQMTVVYFKGKKKGLACNATNTKRIAEHAADQHNAHQDQYGSDDWVGVTVTLRLEDGKQFGGERGDTLRIKKLGAR